MLIVANCLAIVASIGSFILSLIQLRKGTPTSVAKRKRQVHIFVGISILSAALLVFLSFRLKNDVETLEQKGSLEHYSQGVQEIFYPVPYQSPPNVVFEIGVTSYYSSSGPKIVEQRADGFKVNLDLDAYHYNWRAIGIKKGP